MASITEITFLLEECVKLLFNGVIVTIFVSEIVERGDNYMKSGFDNLFEDKSSNIKSYMGASIIIGLFIKFNPQLIKWINDLLSYISRGILVQYTPLTSITVNVLGLTMLLLWYQLHQDSEELDLLSTGESERNTYYIIFAVLLILL